MITQLHTPIPVETPLGDAFAHLVFDYGQEHYLHFVCFLNETGECWIFDNREIRLQPNLTMGVRRPPAPDKGPKSPELPAPRRNSALEKYYIRQVAEVREDADQVNGATRTKRSKSKQ